MLFSLLNVIDHKRLPDWELLVVVLVGRQRVEI